MAESVLTCSMKARELSQDGGLDADDSPAPAPGSALWSFQASVPEHASPGLLEQPCECPGLPSGKDRAMNMAKT